MAIENNFHHNNKYLLSIISINTTIQQMKFKREVHIQQRKLPLN